MRIFLLAGAFCFLSGGLLSEVWAQPLRRAHRKASVIQKHQRHQIRRIRQGVKQGELTRREVRQLMRQQRHIRRERRRALRNDGKVSPGELKHIRQKQRKARRQIFIKKHNHQKAH